MQTNTVITLEENYADKHIITLEENYVDKHSHNVRRKLCRQAQS